MDEPDIDPVLHRQALAGLARLNTFGRSAAILWNALRPLRSRTTPLRILDLACGGGDVAISLAKRARQRGLPWTIVGVDKSDTAIRAAAEAASHQDVNVNFARCDLLDEELPSQFDVVLCSLFLHHLSHEEALAVLSKAAHATRRLLLVSDLNRSRLNYALTWAGCQLLTRSPVVHVDGPISIRAAFTRSEAQRLAHEAGLAEATVESRFPARWLLQWKPS